MFTGRDFYVVGNGVDTTIYKPVNSESLKEKLGMTNEKVILHVTPSFKSPVKGGEHVVEIAKRLQNLQARLILLMKMQAVL